MPHTIMLTKKFASADSTTSPLEVCFPLEDALALEVALAIEGALSLEGPAAEIGVLSRLLLFTDGADAETMMFDLSDVQVFLHLTRCLTLQVGSIEPVAYDSYEC